MTFSFKMMPGDIRSSPNSPTSAPFSSRSMHSGQELDGFVGADIVVGIKFMEIKLLDSVPTGPVDW